MRTLMPAPHRPGPGGGGPDIGGPTLMLASETTNGDGPSTAVSVYVDLLPAHGRPLASPSLYSLWRGMLAPSRWLRRAGHDLDMSERSQPLDELILTVVVDNETDTLSSIDPGVPQAPEVPRWCSGRRRPTGPATTW